MIAPLPAPEPEKLKGGRPRVSDQDALAGIILVMRTGMQWRRLPRSEVDCNGKTSWRLRTWQDAGVWTALHRVLLEQVGIAPDWWTPRALSNEV